MKLSKIATGVLAFTALTVSASAMAHTWALDWRHDYRDKLGQNFDRLCVIANFDNGMYFTADSSFAHNGSDEKGNRDGKIGDPVTNATEFDVGYKMPIEGTGFSLQPGIVMESTSAVTVYKPYFRVNYNTDFGLWTALRLRYDYGRVDGGNPANDADTQTGRVDAWVGYNYGNFGINYNFTYMKSLSDWANQANTIERKMFNNKDYNYEHNVAFGYKMGQWRPYMEIGNIGVDSTSDHRQTRVRVGVTYTF